MPRLLAAFFVCCTSLAFGASSEWPDGSGKSFKAEPADVIGPYAVFRTSRTSGRIVPVRALKPEDCVRFFNEAKTLRSADPAAGGERGRVYHDLKGSVSKVRGGKLAPIDLAKQPEPLVYVLLWHHPRSGNIWRITNTFLVQYRRLRQIYPEWVEAVTLNTFGDATTARQHHERSGLPWLVVEPGKQDKMSSINGLAATNASSIVAVTRSGVPLMACGGDDEEALREFMDKLAQLLRAVSPETPQFWRDRLYYLNATRPVEFADAHADPLLIGSPFNLEAMRRRGIAKVVAHLDVGPDGRVQAAEVVPQTGQDERTAGALSEALRRGLVFSPAVDHGQFVPGKFEYTYAVPPADPMKDAVAAWLNLDPSKEYPLKNWLVLKTFKVEDQVDLVTNRVEEDGTVVLKSVNASLGHATTKEQKNAFATDWFTPEQAALLSPVKGQKETIGGKEFVWKKVSSVGHAVELQDGFGREEYCYCYAWTEIDVPAEQNAILGFGSDDGVKIWLNGEVILERWIKRPLRVDEDVLPLRLRKGKNQLMLKVQNIYGEWSFSCRLVLQPSRAQAAPASDKP